MKKLYFLYPLLIALSFVLTGVLLTFMPEQVPMHYDVTGLADRIGSKYEYFIFPALSLLISALFIVLARRRKQHSSEEKVFAATGLFLLLFFNILGGYFMVQAITYSSAGKPDMEQHIFRFTFIAIGLLLVVMGNLMPKFRRNSAIGIRTTWSMSSDSVWQKSQRFGGFASVICGLAMILFSSFLPDIACLIVNSLLILGWVIASTVASYKYYKAEQ